MCDELVIIDEHAFKHGIAAEDIEWAWEHFSLKQYRGSPHEGEILLVGFTRRGKEVEIVAHEYSFGTVIYHALSPLSSSIKRELGIVKQTKGRFG